MERTKKKHFVWAAVIGIVLALSIRSSLFELCRVPTKSMLPTITPGDRILVNKAHFAIHMPFTRKILVNCHPVQRGDVVVVRYKSDLTMKYVKRVIALPGERIRIKDGQVYIDDRPLKESYFSSNPPEENFPETLVPPESVFVMGDNRGASIDSRIVGFVHTSDIEGKVAFMP